MVSHRSPRWPALCVLDLEHCKVARPTPREAVWRWEVESSLCVSGATSEWVGRSEAPTGLSWSDSGLSVGRSDPQGSGNPRKWPEMAPDRLLRGPRGSVGRVFRPKICFAALRAVGRSIGCAESETLDFIIVGRSVDTQSELSTSRRLYRPTVVYVIRCV